jgi:hypothetical protein
MDRPFDRCDQHVCTFVALHAGRAKGVQTTGKARKISCTVPQADEVLIEVCRPRGEARRNAGVAYRSYEGVDPEGNSPRDASIPTT